MRVFIPAMVLLLLFCPACNNRKAAPVKQPGISFDKTKWAVKDKGTYTYRRQMVRDLLDHYQWTGVSKDSVIRMLGAPDNIEADAVLMYYYEQEPALFGIMSSHKALSFELAPDMTKVKSVRRSEGTGWD